jgi:hypothetical protein
MKLKKITQNKIYSNKQFKNQIWYNQQIIKYFWVFLWHLKSVFLKKKKKISENKINSEYFLIMINNHDKI